MTPVRIATARNADTSPMVQPSVSMKYLQLIISTVPGVPPTWCKPGTVGYHFYMICRLSSRLLHSFTLVKMPLGKTVCDTVNAFLWFIITTRPGVWPVFDPVNISGKYRDNGWPVPAGSAGLVSCRLSKPGTASRAKYTAWTPAWRWSVFPVALSCKAQPVVSYLLY
jgi:hypothetical protein